MQGGGRARNAGDALLPPHAMMSPPLSQREPLICPQLLLGGLSLPGPVPSTAEQRVKGRWGERAGTAGPLHAPQQDLH